MLPSRIHSLFFWFNSHTLSILKCSRIGTHTETYTHKLTYTHTPILDYTEFLIRHKSNLHFPKKKMRRRKNSSNNNNNNNTIIIILSELCESRTPLNWIESYLLLFFLLILFLILVLDYFLLKKIHALFSHSKLHQKWNSIFICGNPRDPYFQGGDTFEFFFVSEQNKTRTHNKKKDPRNSLVKIRWTFQLFPSSLLNNSQFFFSYFNFFSLYNKITNF